MKTERCEWLKLVASLIVASAMSHILVKGASAGIQVFVRPDIGDVTNETNPRYVTVDGNDVIIHLPLSPGPFENGRWYLIDAGGGDVGSVTVSTQSGWLGDIKVQIADLYGGIAARNVGRVDLVSGNYWYPTALFPSHVSGSWGTLGTTKVDEVYEIIADGDVVGSIDVSGPIRSRIYAGGSIGSIAGGTGIQAGLVAGRVKALGGEIGYIHAVDIEADITAYGPIGEIRASGHIGMDGSPIDIKAAGDIRFIYANGDFLHANIDATFNGANGSIGDINYIDAQVPYPPQYYCIRAATDFSGSVTAQHLYGCISTGAR